MILCLELEVVSNKNGNSSTFCLILSWSNKFCSPDSTRLQIFSEKEEGFITVAVFAGK